MRPRNQLWLDLLMPLHSGVLAQIFFRSIELEGRRPESHARSVSCFGLRVNWASFAGIEAANSLADDVALVVEFTVPAPAVYATLALVLEFIVSNPAVHGATA